MRQGNPKTFKGWALVAFIDLLGFSRDVKSWWNDPDKCPLKRLLRIKEAAASIPNAGVVFGTPGGPFDPTVHRARIHTVSDSIVVCSALPSAGNLNHLTKAMTVVSQGVQMAWVAAIREGYTLRGAIELGEIYWTESETIGPAFIDSYCFESKIAKESRVIMGPSFLENLIECMNEDWSGWPSSEWFAVSHDKLIEMSPHLLMNDRANLEGLEALRRKAGGDAFRYDRILETLRTNHFRKANRDDFVSGKAAIESRIDKPRKTPPATGA